MEKCELSKFWNFIMCKKDMVNDEIDLYFNCGI